MVADVLFRLPVIIVVVAWIGIALSYVALRSFKLRQWQIAATYLFTGLVTFMLYAFINAFSAFMTASPVFAYAEAGMKLVSLTFIILALHRIRQTASWVGA